MGFSLTLGSDLGHGTHLQIVHARVLLHGPNLERHVVRARGQQLPLRIPLDGVDFVLKIKAKVSWLAIGTRSISTLTVCPWNDLIGVSL